MRQLVDSWSNSLGHWFVGTQRGSIFDSQIKANTTSIETKPASRRSQTNEGNRKKGEQRRKNRSQKRQRKHH